MTLEPGPLGRGKGTFSMAFRGHVGQVTHVTAAHWQHYKARKAVSGELPKRAQIAPYSAAC